MANLTKEELRHDAVHEELEKITVTVVKKRNTILLVGVAVVAVIIALSQYSSGKKNRVVAAENALAQAGTNMLAVSEIPARYAGTHAAKTALLALAGDALSSTNYAAAAEYFTKVATEYPSDECAPASWLAVARCLVGQEKYDEALSVLQTRLASGPHAMSAKSLAMKIYALQGKNDEALAAGKELADVKDNLGKVLTQDLAAEIQRRGTVAFEKAEEPAPAAEEAGEAPAPAVE